jgi:uncharacterized FAD-dependent dehydrogenase
VLQRVILPVDAEVRDQPAVLARLSTTPTSCPSPDTGYQFVARGEQLQGHDRNERPVVIGTGPCGQFAAQRAPQQASEDSDGAICGGPDGEYSRSLRRRG